MRRDREVIGQEMERADVENPKLQSNTNAFLAELFTIPPKEQCQIQEHYWDVKAFQCHGLWDYFAQTDHYSFSLALTPTLLEVIVSSSWALGEVLHQKPLWMHNNFPQSHYSKFHLSSGISFDFLKCFTCPLVIAFTQLPYDRWSVCPS